jgi:hypothetical protein
VSTALAAGTVGTGELCRFRGHLGQMGAVF